MTQNQTPAVVIDNGSGMCKAGFSGQDGPRTCFPAVVGCARHLPITAMGANSVYIGQEAIAKKGILKLHFPVEHGVVTDWDYMTKIWHHCYYNELRTSPQDQPCLLTEAPMNPKVNRERMTEIMFENFEVPHFYLAIQAVLSLYSSGKTTGIVLDAGDGVTHTVPVYEGYALNHAVERQNFAGRDLNTHMQKLLTEIGLNFTSSSQMEIARTIKEQTSYIALDFDQEMQEYSESKQKNKPYELPDGQMIQLGTQMFRCPEALFNPKMAGQEVMGFHQMVHDCIKKCDIDIRRSLYDNIVLSGGTTMFTGIKERMTKELLKLSPICKPRVLAAAERKFLVWIGGSILTELSTFQTQWISKEEYQENGATIVHKKCF